MTSDNVKATLYAVAGLAAAFVVYRAYTTAKGIQSTLSGAAGDVERKIVEGIGNLSTAVGNIANQVQQSAKQTAVDMGLMNPDGWVSEIPLSQWPENIKTFVISIQRLRGRAGGQITAADFSGWKLYSNGTLTSPAGEYFLQKDYANGDIAFQEVFYNGLTSWDIEAVSYPKVGGLTGTTSGNSYADMAEAGMP